MMNRREIQSLMRRVFYFRTSTKDTYRHLMKDEMLDDGLVTGLLNDYIHTEDVIVYADAQKCAHVVMKDAYNLIASSERIIRRGLFKW